MANECKNKVIAETILAQLGGRRFAMMTGASSFSYGENCLTFRLKSNPKNVKGVRITLEPSDTYKMEFLGMRKYEVILKSEADFVYADMLQDVFTEHTGLYTHL